MPKYPTQTILEFIKAYHAEHGYAPSIRDIQDGLSIKSSNSVWLALVDLRNARLIDWAPNVARSIVVRDVQEVSE